MAPFSPGLYEAQPALWNAWCVSDPSDDDRVTSQKIYEATVASFELITDPALLRMLDVLSDAFGVGHSSSELAGESFTRALYETRMYIIDHHREDIDEPRLNKLRGRSWGHLVRHTIAMKALVMITESSPEVEELPSVLTDIIFHDCGPELKQDHKPIDEIYKV